MRQLPDLIGRDDARVHGVDRRRHRRAVQPRQHPRVHVLDAAAAVQDPRLREVGRANGEPPPVLERRRRGPIAPPGEAVALFAQHREIRRRPRLDRRGTAAGIRSEVQRLGGGTLGEEPREALQVDDEVVDLLVGEIGPARHRRAGEAVLDREPDVGVRRELPAPGRPDLVERLREIARPRQHRRGGRAIPLPGFAVTFRAPAVVHDLARGGRIFLTRECVRRPREEGEEHDSRSARRPHSCPPSSSHVRGGNPVWS